MSNKYEIVKFNNGKYGALNTESGEYLDMELIASVSNNRVREWPLHFHDRKMPITSRFQWWVKLRINKAIRLQNKSKPTKLEAVSIGGREAEK